MVQENLFQNQFDSPYKVIHDEFLKAWKIYDLKHASIVNLLSKEPDPDIPDDSPAVKILSEGEFIALIKKAVEEEVLVNAVVGSTDSRSSSSKVHTLEESLKNEQEKVLNLEKDIVTLKYALEEAKAQPKFSESFYLKEKSIQALLKLTGLHDISETL